MKRKLTFLMVIGLGLTPAVRAQIAPPAPVAQKFDLLRDMESAREALDEARFELKGLDGLSALSALSALDGLDGLKGLAVLDAMRPTAPMADGLFDDSREWLQQGTNADSVYARARAALNRGDYREASRLFQQVSERYPRSNSAGDALYWQAYSLRRLGGDSQLREALRALEKMDKDYKEAATKSEATALSTAIRGDLAQRGDAVEGERIAREAERAARPSPAPRAVSTPEPPRPPQPARAPRASRGGRGSDEPPPGCPSAEDDDKMAALNALLQMDADRAMPVLQRVIDRRDPCSELLRRRAVFLIAQQKSTESADILLKAARTDPDLEVKRQAVFWLGQVKDDRAVDLLQELLKSSDDPELTERALFAMSQHKGQKAADALRAYVEQANAPEDLRERAVFWLGQTNSPENAAYLKGLYEKVQTQELKERVLFSLSQMKGSDNAAWLLGIAQSNNEPIEMRKKALFWAGQMNVVMPDLTALYDKVTDRDMKETLIFTYSQRQRDAAAVDKLMAIAKSEPDKELRRKALFWLSQTKDPRVVKFLEDLINQ